MAEDLIIRGTYRIRPIENEFKRFPFRGKSDNYQVYEIPLDAIFYNDLNGRIVTIIQADEARRGKSVDYGALRREDPEEYQRRFEEFIEKQNPGKLQELRRNIALFGQLEPGIILTDGRIIDGNRRYTALRKNARDSGETLFFHAAVLPAPEAEDKEGWRYIKMLELQIALAKMQPLEYTPIARLADFYRATRDPNTVGLLSSKEYQRNAGMTVGDLKKLSDELDIALDFLEWKGTPLSFEYLERKAMDGPLREIIKYRRKWTEAEYEGMKSSIYTFLDEGDGDMTRKIREYLKYLWDSPTAREKARSFSLPTLTEERAGDALGKGVSDEMLRDAEESVFVDLDYISAQGLLDKSSKAYRALNDFLAFENIRALGSLSKSEQEELKNRLKAIRALCLEDRALARWAFGEEEKD